jgi:hypothetical protein
MVSCTWRVYVIPGVCVSDTVKVCVVQGGCVFYRDYVGDKFRV